MNQAVTNFLPLILCLFDGFNDGSNLHKVGPGAGDEIYLHEKVKSEKEKVKSRR
jgi:hypothetical protein